MKKIERIKNNMKTIATMVLSMKVRNIFRISTLKPFYTLYYDIGT